MYFISSPCSHRPTFVDASNSVTFQGSYSFNTLNELKNELIGFNWFDDKCIFDNDQHLNEKNKYIDDIINELTLHKNDTEFIKLYHRLSMNEGCCHVIITYMLSDDSTITMSKQLYEKFDQSLNDYFGK